MLNKISQVQMNNATYKKNTGIINFSSKQELVPKSIPPSIKKTNILEKLLNGVKQIPSKINEAWWSVLEFIGKIF